MPKNSTEADNLSPIKEIIEAKKGKLKPPVKKQATKKKTKPQKKKVAKKTKRPVVTDAMHEAWFFKISNKYFIQLQREWNERNLKIKIIPQENYDQWLNYFKTLPPNSIRMLATTGLDILPTEAYAALARWHDIISNPARIDKIHQSGLTNPQKNKATKSIVQLALENDRLGVLKATRDKIAEKLDKGAGARDTAALTREMTEIMTQISDYEKRLGPKKETLLGQLMKDMPEIKPKRPGYDGGGARKTSFRSRVTIEDIEQ